MKETTGGYAATLHLFSAMLAVAFVLSWVLAWKGQEMKKSSRHSGMADMIHLKQTR